MRRHQLSLDQYDTDKIANGYLRWYDPVLIPWIERDLVLLEIGVARGGSLRLWRDYFPGGTIVGIDPHLPDGMAHEHRIRMFPGSQEDTAFLSEVALQTAPDGFDIIIDDASHIAALTRVSFWHLFDRHLKPGGLYVIEDWGTGYWDDWPDGKTRRPRSSLYKKVQKIASGLGLSMPDSDNHGYGMVGFIKELVDEQGAADLTRAMLSGAPKRFSRFENMLITPSIVFIQKAATKFSAG